MVTGLGLKRELQCAQVYVAAKVGHKQLTNPPHPFSNTSLHFTSLHHFTGSQTIWRTSFFFFLNKSISLSFYLVTEPLTNNR